MAWRVGAFRGLTLADMSANVLPMTQPTRPTCNRPNQAEDADEFCGRPAGHNGGCAPAGHVFDYIEPDAYAGRWSRAGVPAGMRVSVFTAAELAAFSSEGVIWESFGHVNGRECFGRSRYMASATGALHVYDSNGRKILVHPATRAIRVLAR